MKLSIPGPCGPLEAELWEPEEAPRAACVMCHPNPSHGGTMNSTPLFRSAKGLHLAGLAVLRFNFRGVGASAGEFDGVGAEQDDLSAALDLLTERFPACEPWAGGFSFGAWTAASLALREARIRRLVLVALPVLACRVDALRDLSTPGLALSAGEDSFGNLAALRERLPRWDEVLELDQIEATDHFFRGRTAELQERVRRYAVRVLTNTLEERA